jgi:hypothetical protein
VFGPGLTDNAEVCPVSHWRGCGDARQTTGRLRHKDSDFGGECEQVRHSFARPKVKGGDRTTTKPHGHPCKIAKVYIPDARPIRQLETSEVDCVDTEHSKIVALEHGRETAPVKSPDVLEMMIARATEGTVDIPLTEIEIFVVRSCEEDQSVTLCHLPQAREEVALVFLCHMLDCLNTGDQVELTPKV